jgi:FkbM family methyltransferase
LIEPIPSKAALLRKEFLPPQHEVLECVVAQEAGTLTLELNEALATSSVLRINREAPELTQVHLGTPRYLDREARTLDDIAAASRLEWIDLLKLDVQGFEDRILRGGRQALARTALIWTEVSFVPLYENSCAFPDLHQFLREAGFSLIDLEEAFRAPDGELLQADALYRRKAR